VIIIGLFIGLLSIAIAGFGKLFLIVAATFYSFRIFLKLVREIKYRIEYVRKSKVDEEKFLETSLSDPPFRRL
jgi:hypothetical protein